MHSILRRDFGFAEENIKLLVDDVESQPQNRSTRENIIVQLQWLAECAAKHENAHLVWHFSGESFKHSSAAGDSSTTESVIQDCILPCDEKEKGPITDQDLRREFISKLPAAIANGGK